MADEKKLLCLESIRGLAACMVVADHLLFAFRPDINQGVVDPHGGTSLPVRALIQTPLAFLYSGSFAVNIFFVLSGFVLSYSYFRTGRPDALTGPALRRYFRLMIPSAISIFGACALLKAGLSPVDSAASVTGSGWLTAWYHEMTPSFVGWNHNSAIYQALYGIFSGDANWYNNVLWTMRIELIGSFLVYGTLALVGWVRHRQLIYLVLAGLLILTGQLWYLGFVIGMAACDAFTNRSKTNRLVDIGWIGWLAVFCGLMLGGYHGQALPLLHGRIPGSNYHQPIGATLVVLAPLLSASLRRVLDAKPLVFLGRISFGLYLVHVPVICSLGCRLLLTLVKGHGWGVHPASAVSAAACVIVSLILGWVMYHIADRPSIAVGRLVSNWFTGTGRKTSG